MRIHTLLLALCFFLFAGTTAQTQQPQPWATNGNSIYNTNSGNVGIGTTNPGSLLHLNQSVGTNAGAIRITNGSITTYLFGDAAGTVHFDNSGAYLLLNENGGNVGIGTMTPSSRLHVAGDVTVTGNISARYQDIEGTAMKSATHRACRRQDSPPGNSYRQSSGAN